MSKSLHILVLEDEQADAELIVEVLRQGGVVLDYTRIETEQAYLANLNNDFDLILADYQLPQFSVLSALRHLQERNLDIPLIVITGSTSEEAVVECMREGAADYLLKDRLARLGPAVIHALEAKRLRDEKRQIEMALRQSEALNRTVLNSLTAHIAVLDGAGNITVVNDAWTRFASENNASRELAAGVGINYLDVCRKAAERGNKESRAALLGIQSVLDGTRSHFSLEYSCNSPKQERWFVMSVTPLDGAFRGVTVSHTDISDRKQAEEVIQASEKRFRALIENSADGILLIDPQGIMLYESAAVSRIGGYSAEMRRGRNVLDFLDPEVRPQLSDVLNDLVQRPGASVTVQFRLRHEDGMWRWIDATATNMLPEPGIGAIVVNYRDITQRKEIETALEQERHLLRILIDNLPDYIFITDTESRFIVTNIAQARLLGAKDPDELIGKTDLDFLPRELAEESYASEQEIIKKGLPVINYEEPSINFVTGKSVWHLTTKVPYRDTQGNVQGLVGIARDITERKRAEEELRKVSRAIEQSPNMIVITNLTGEIEYVNPRFTQMTGYTSQEIVGKNRSMLAVGTMSPGMQKQMEETLLAGREWRGELEERNKNGDTYWASISIAPILDTQGQLSHLVTVLEDVTARRKLDEALHKSENAEREQRILAEALRDMTAALVTILNPDLVMARILETIDRVVPHDAADIMILEGKTVRVAYSRGWSKENQTLSSLQQIDLESVPGLLRMALTGSPSLIPDVSKDPEWKDLGILRDPPIRSSVATPIKAHNHTIGFLNLNSATQGFFTAEHAERLLAFANYAAIAIENAQLYDEIRRYADNLERHVEERTAELQQVKEHIEAIFNSSSDAIIVAGINGIIQQVNPAFTELFYDQIEGVLGQAIYKFVQDGYRDNFMKELHTVRYDYQRKRIEFIARRKDGSEFNAEGALSPIIVRNRKTQEIETFDVVCIVRDITERKRFEKELQELNQLKTEFLSTAAHELRTPLTSIRGFSEILLTRVLDQDRQRKYIALINEQSTQLGQLIDDLLDISRLEAKRSLTLDLVPINISDIIDSVLKPFQESVVSHTIDYKRSSDCPLIVGDMGRLSQVLKNLVSNAIKYSPQGGTITIEIRPISHYLQVSIQDEGIGMTPDQLSHVFEKFYRANASNTAINGTGLGLAISKLIVEMHGGEILAESKYGVGTTIYFTLPLAREEIVNKLMSGNKP